MGSGRWSAASYRRRVVGLMDAHGDVFVHDRVAKQSGNLKVHQTLDPQGLGIRESRDSAEHPDSNAIVISLDVTGSMSKVVRGIHEDLPRLHELLLGHNYIPHPQVLFAAVGDATCDHVPLQVGQFESDNRMDQNLENMILEGGGGGQKTESYELTMYVAARHTAIDCWEKRQRKGYVFMIGDEMAYPRVKREEVEELIGPGVQADVPLEEIVEEVRRRYHLYFIIPGGASHGADKEVLRFWQRHVGPEHVLQLDDPEDTSECIALTIGMREGVISMEEGADHLRKRGVVGRAIERVMTALTSLLPGTPTVRPKGPRRL